MNFVKKHSKKFIVGTLLAALTAWSLTYAVEGQYRFVRGEYGTKCYPIDNYHKNIKFLVKFRTLEDCEASIRHE